MTVNEKLLLLAQSQKGREAWVDLMWSSGWRNSVLYTLFRSKGFFARRFSNHAIDFIEIVGFGFCTSPDVFMLAGAIALVGWILSVFCEALIHSLRSALLFGEAIPVSFMAAVSVVIAVVVYTLMVTYSLESFLYPPIAIFAAVKATLSLLSIWVNVRTAEINIRRRVYFPPVLNFLLVALSAAIVLAIINLRIKALTGLYILIGGHFVIGVLGAIASIILARRAEFFEKILNRNPEKVLPFQNWQVLASRVAVFISQFVPPLLLVFTTSLGKTPELVFWALGFRPLSLAIICRPFRSLYVDLFGAIVRQEWELIAMRVRNARNLAATILLGTLITIFVYAIASESMETHRLFFAWLLVSLAVQFFLNQAIAVAQELKLYTPTLLLRVAVPFAAWILGGLININLLMVCFIAEGALLAVAIRFHQKHDLAEGLTFDHALNRDTKAASNYVLPSEFISCFGVLSPVLKKFGYDDGLYELTLRTSIRSTSKMEQLLLNIGRSLRITDRIMALDSRRLLVWAPTSTATLPIHSRLVVKFPLLVQDFKKVSLDVLMKKDVSGLAPLVSHSIVQSPKALLALLEVRFSEFNRGQHQGTWWTLDESGQWVSLTSVASPGHAKALFGLKRRYADNPILSHVKGQFIAEINELAVPFRPYGQVIAVYTVPESGMDQLKALPRLGEYFLSGYLNYTFQNVPILPPTYWYAVRNVLQSLSKTKRLSLRLVEIKAGEKLSGTSKVHLCARTSQGSYAIDLGYEEIEQSVQQPAPFRQAA